MPIPFFEADEHLAAVVNKAHAYVASADALVRTHVSYADAGHLVHLRTE
jgi:hypothetical protein